MGTVLAGGTVVTAIDCFRADIRLVGERIAAVGMSLKQTGDQVVDCSGCYLFPGGIDPHTHFDLPVGNISTADDFLSGTSAAAVGGTTTIIDFATQEKGESLSRALEVWHRKAAGKSYVDYGFHLALTDVRDDIINEMELAVKEAGVSSFKLYMAYKNVLQVDDGALYKAFKKSRDIGALICLHCENGDVIHSLVEEARSKGWKSPKYHALTRPPAVEEEATGRAVLLARMAGAPLYVVHVSSAGALRHIRDARSSGQAVYAETCPQYLVLDESAYDAPDFNAAKYVMSPPLRSRDNQEVLMNGLRTGILSTVGSDHCSFNFVGGKDLGINDFSRIPNGAPGVENRMGILYTLVAAGQMSLNKFVEVTSTAAARIFGMYPRKGTIAPGADGDIVVWDPTIKRVIQADNQVQRVDYNPYEGFMQVGRPAYVFLRGQLIVKEGLLLNEYPAGRYLARQSFRQEQLVTGGVPDCLH